VGRAYWGLAANLHYVTVALGYAWDTGKQQLTG
jgi:hypothetical protein